MSEKYKRIGWVVEQRVSSKTKWEVGYEFLCATKKEIKILYGAVWLKNEIKLGLARCVPVYVEVQDAKA